MSLSPEDRAWSCDERDPDNCRNAHGCHCKEIAALLASRAPMERIADRDDAYLYRHMLEVAQANGFESLTDAITVARKAREAPAPVAEEEIAGFSSIGLGVPAPVAADVALEETVELGYRTPLKCTLACMDDMADWIERTKPQGVLYSACLPALRDGAASIRETQRLAELGKAAEAAGLVGREGGNIWLQPPHDEAPAPVQPAGDTERRERIARIVHEWFIATVMGEDGRPSWTGTPRDWRDYYPERAAQAIIAAEPAPRGEDQGRLRATPCAPGSSVDPSSKSGEGEMDAAREWLTRLLDGVVNANSAAEAVALQAYRSSQ